MSEVTGVADQAWVRYADRIRAAGELITGDGFPTDPRLRAEGYRYVARLTAQAHYLFVEFADTERPTLFSRGGDVTAYGATNVDNQNSRCMLDPAGTYRVHGDIARVRELILSVHEGEFVYGKPAVLAERCLADLDIGQDGQLELILGGPERPTNWMPLPPLGTEGAYFGIRQFISDWENDAIATLHIERLDAIEPLENLTPDAIARGLDNAATWVEANVIAWNRFSLASQARTPVNGFAPPRYAEGGAVNMVHSGTVWQLEPDQAIIIEIDEPDATYWSIQNYVLHWLMPLDFVNRVTSLNDAQVRVDDDAVVRIVLSHQDPGVQNWLDTSGLPKGSCSARWVRAATPPTEIRSQVVDFADVRRHLPADTPDFTAQDRTEQIAGRRRGANRRFRR